MFDEEQIEKIECLENLLASIQSKTKAISNQTKFLKTFNKKLEILLKCFEAYSFDDNFVENEQNNIENTRDIKEKPKNTDIQNCYKPKEISHIDEMSVAIKNEFDLNHILEQIFSLNSAQKYLANNIIDLIRSKVSISLDDLVKNIKQSKYKVIDVLNILIKEKIIIKSFEKGFVYRISKEIN